MKPVFLVTLGAVAGAVIGVVNGGGELGRAIADGIIERTSALIRTAEARQAPRLAMDTALSSEASHSVFSSCLARSGDSVEGTLRNLLEFHEHDATVALVGCLLDGPPQRFCTPAGRRQAADAMEIYLWSRDDGRRSSPAHGLAAKIHWLDRAAETGETGEPVDPFALTWSGPADRAVFDKLKGLVKDGWLDPSAFAYSGRMELREALRDVKAEAAPCAPLARGD